jgi:hypothetical protein
MSNLSPAAQAVLNAMHRSYDHEPTRRAIAAAAIRALVDWTAVADRRGRRQGNIRRAQLAIAAELEGKS